MSGVQLKELAVEVGDKAVVPSWWESFLAEHGDVAIIPFSLIDVLGRLDTLASKDYYNTQAATSLLEQSLFRWLNELVSAEAKLKQAIETARLPAEDIDSIRNFEQGLITYSKHIIEEPLPPFLDKYYYPGKEMLDIVLPGLVKKRGIVARENIDQPYRLMLTTFRSRTKVLWELLEAQGRWVSIEELVEKTNLHASKIKEVSFVSSMNANYPREPWNPVKVVSHVPNRKSKMVTHYRVKPSVIR